MSYILDALRRADAERERGSVPGIHAQPIFAGARPSGPPATSRLWIVIAVIGVLLALAVALAVYLLFGRSPAGEAAAPAMPPPAASMAAVPVAPTTPVPVPAPTPAPLAVAPPARTAPAPVHKPRPVPPAATPASAAAPVPAPMPAAIPTPVPAPTATPKTDERIYTVNELPDDIRRQLPALSVGGSMYSPSPANRLVIINGQVLHEGEHITPDLVVQQIRLKAAVLAFKGYRYTLAF